MVAMITDQRRISQAAKKDGNALKRLSMMGAIFLPGTFLASIFSMVFFRLPEGESLMNPRTSGIKQRFFVQWKTANTNG
jgi:hypothetical protein